MRKLIPTLLLLATATPLLAQPVPLPDQRLEDARRDGGARDDRDRGGYRNDRGSDRRDRGDWNDRDRQSDRRDDRVARYDDRRQGNYRADGYRPDNRGGYGSYRGPAYNHPRGYGYRAYAPGYRVPRAYFDSRYFIERPGDYRLPQVYGGTRWVRIGPDALLIRLTDRIVVRSVRGLFY